eukprot:9030438-Pyramimonas_sp.AAC.1
MPSLTPTYPSTDEAATCAGTPWHSPRHIMPAVAAATGVRSVAQHREHRDVMIPRYLYHDITMYISGKISAASHGLARIIKSEPVEGVVSRVSDFSDSGTRPLGVSGPPRSWGPR